MKVSLEEARRIAVRAQALDGSATDVLETVRRLGFLQIDVVAPVERPQHLVLFSRLGPRYDRAELDRLLWEERALFEWDAFIYPIEDLPLVRARIRNFRRSRKTKGQRWAAEFLAENRAFKRYVLREIERNGPLLSRDLEDRSKGEREKHRWWGARKVGLMLLCLHIYGEITVVGRQGGERLWDLTSRWWPETETVSIRRRGARSATSGASAPKACGSSRASGRRIRTPRTAPCPTAPSSSPPSTAWSTTATAPRRCGTSATGSRCSSRRRSASTATTCCRSWSGTRSSAGPSRASTGRPACSSCSGPGATRPAWTKPSPTSRRGWAPLASSA